jgi:serpin B
MKKLFAFYLIAFVMACQDSSVEPDNTPNLRALSSEEMQVSAATNDFAFALFAKLDGASSENSFISPLSVSMALGMVLNGASEETKESILNTIDYSGYSTSDINQGYHDLTKLLLSMDRKVTLGIANSVWYSQEYKVNQDFAAIIKEQYDGKIQGLDFSSNQAKETINNWVENKTNKKIRNIIENISQKEVMFLVNAIYFKGDWTYKFDKSKTHDAPFKTIDGTTVTTDMMFSKGATVELFSNSDVQVLNIPYGNKQFNFTIVAPYSGFDEVIRDLTASQLDEWLGQADSVKVELEIPRFKMTWKQDLKETLRKMGMKMNDFSGLLATTEELEITRVIHQTFLDVNEEGSEAAAATAIGIGLTMAPPSPTRITIDRPFLFMIREKYSGAILFIGKLVNPRQLEN